MYPYLLPEVFGYTIPMYDLMMGLGVIMLIIFVSKRFDREHKFTHKETNKLLILIIISLIVALISSALFDTVFHSIKEGKFTFGTITFIGGLIGGVVAFLLLLKFFFKSEKKDTYKIMNTVITGVVLAHAIGRIGCFFAGCCYGVPTNSFLGVIFPHGLAHEKFPGTKIYPTQLFESFFLFALFFILLKVEKLKGHELITYLFSYGIARIIIEFFRGDDRGTLLPFIETTYNAFPSPSQYLSLVMIGFGIFLIVKNNKLNKQEN